jgi:LysM repeat protein
MRPAMDDRARNPLRLLAPIALVVAALLFLIVISASIGGDDEETGGDTAAEQAGPREQAGAPETAPEQGTYEVKPGDTLDSIADETGVSVEELLELNPMIDPQSLGTGQRLKLSE